MTTRAVKIIHEDEIRKLKDISTYQSLTEIITNKLAIELEHYDLTYYDEEGDTITISNEDDFDECMNVFMPKVPKIFLKSKEAEDQEEEKLEDNFPDIALTVSTCERPGSFARDSSPDKEEFAIIEDQKNEENSEIRHEVKDYHPIEEPVAQQEYEEEKESEHSEAGIQTEEDKVIESDEKSTSMEISEMPIIDSSVQTQSIDNVEAGTDAELPVE